MDNMKRKLSLLWETQTSSNSVPLFGTLDMCLFWLMLPFILIPILLYRAGLRVAARLIHPDWGPMLQPHGALFLQQAVHLETNANCLLALTLEGKLRDSDGDGEGLKNLISQRLVYARNNEGKYAYPELRQYLVSWGFGDSNYFFWKPEASFNIGDHVKVRKLGRNIDGGGNLHLIQTNFVREPLAEARSPWQILLLEEAARGRTHLWIKYHHLLADGASLIQALSRCTDPDGSKTSTGYLKQPTTLESEQWRRQQQQQRRSSRAASASIVAELLRFLTVRVEVVRTTLSASMLGLSVAGNLSARERIHANGGAQSQATAAATQRANMELVSGIARRQNVTPSAVIYTALTGAVRNYFVTRSGGNEVPSFLGFPHPMPVPKRRYPDRLACELASATFMLPVGEANVPTRLEMINTMISDRKHSMEPRISQFLLTLLGMLPFRLRPSSARTASVGMWMGSSNVAGPPIPIILNGQRVTGMSILGTGLPFPFYTVFVSYAGNLEWTCDADRRLMSQEELDKIGGDISLELEALDNLPDSY